jgi:hypothetical protein
VLLLLLLLLLLPLPLLQLPCNVCDLRFHAQCMLHPEQQDACCLLTLSERGGPGKEATFLLLSALFLPLPPLSQPERQPAWQLRQAG